MMSTDSSTHRVGGDVTSAPPVAVVGASGYVGRLLTEQLAGTGRHVLAISRRMERLPRGPGIDRLALDVDDVDGATAALEGVAAAYYLVHAMAEGARFAERDRVNAGSFAVAARRAGVGRIVYLGGLGGEHASDHLSSRHEVGQILRSTGVAVVELRAAVILGAGSISFEMLRYLTERLPVMVCPRWVSTRLQPLAQSDLLDYLCQSLDASPGTYEIGTPDVTTYYEMMQAYASIRGLRRRKIVKVPLLTPALSAHWVDLVTPVDRLVSHSLIGSLGTEVTVHDPEATGLMFDVRPMAVAEAIRAAIDAQTETLPTGLFDRDPGLSDGVYTMRSEVTLPAERAGAARRGLSGIGGTFAWYGVAWAWRLRRAIGRPFGEDLQLQRSEVPAAGAGVDWWTIVCIDEAQLVLASKDWFFGDAWLGYRIISPTDVAGGEPAVVVQVAAFRPRGVPGLAYWWVLWPIHRLVFRFDGPPSGTGFRISRRSGKLRASCARVGQPH